ncbi:hypothetical protein ASPZODRAFT_146946 [Penicilliopsis zonata CBS 506.65]|uniref:beta-glucosidase n=1 Tax=Penicilliopsis zonata CBS 506.65 TaxID=1073090 RepID=A0A1L9S6L2_9EURO|nr:hypothetical protein ASPZODRAFT_146946 [Penicilliopsis zonata CBS 506.65]OJJ42775.1 hypothetical protein ASPZODRAFT_146946 [Penicilliopsis zonata CBS 506.65]
MASFIAVLAFTASVQATNFTELELFWSYGRSPPVYPSPPGAGLGDWSAAYARARADVANLTNEEKNNMTYGYDSETLAFINGCSGLSYGVASIGYPGMCLSDAGNGLRGAEWSAQLTGIASANAGLDVAMPDSTYWEGTLSEAVANGSMTQARLDDMATRARVWHAMPSVIANLGGDNVDARNPAATPTIFQGAVEGQVLLKNYNNTLPLSKPKHMAIYGYDAPAPPKVNPPASMAWWMGDESLGMVDSLALDNLTYLTSFPESAYNGTLIGGGGSGGVSPPYIHDPFSALSAQARLDGTYLSWDFTEFNPLVPVGTDVCLVLINEFSTESRDRPGLADPDSDALVETVASQCPNTVVVIHNAGIRLVDAWIDNENVTAVLLSHLPGQDTGAALVEVLYGRQSPSGRLPYTIAKRASDYGALLAPTRPSATSDYYTQGMSTIPKALISTTAISIAHNITPQVEFGYGLTYSTFSYSDIAVSVSNASLPAYAPGTEIQQGGLPSLWNVVASVACTITNTGSVTAAEVPQLYVGIPGGSEKTLRGFDKVSLAPGELTRVQFDLKRRDLSVWDVVGQQWELQSGIYNVYVGASVLDIKLTSSLSLSTEY